MKLNYVCLLAIDVPTTVRFWRDVMQLPLTYYDEKTGYAAFDSGGTTLADVSRAGDRRRWAARAHSIGVVKTGPAGARGEQRRAEEEESAGRV